ncbi:MAG TPA: hypothetical protein VJX67_07335 [Blastocatellia bacterium]|nr:hypothetical protein [Blastocatellia bacterium]
MMKKPLAMLGLLLVLAVSAPAQAVDADHLITPGVGIGKIRLGMPLTDVIYLIGSPDNATPGLVGSYIWGRKLGDGAPLMHINTLSVNGQEVVETVSVSARDEYVTTSGLHTGLTERAAFRIMGKPRSVDMNIPKHTFLMYCGLSLTVLHDPASAYDGRVIDILVIEKNSC